MAKRFTDTDKWKKKFIRGLDASYKVLWLYILDDCNHAGVWDVDLEVAQIRTGCNFKEVDAINYFGDKIQSFDDGEKWFIPDFIEFQYGELNEANRVHKSVLDHLSKYKIKGLKRGLLDPKDKDKDKVKDKDKDKKKVFVAPTPQEIESYALEQGYKVDGVKISSYYCDEQSNWIDSKGTKVKNWKQKVLSVWCKEENQVEKEHNEDLKDITTLIESKKYWVWYENMKDIKYTHTGKQIISWNKNNKIVKIEQCRN